MKKYMVAIATVLTLLSSVADAKGGFSSGGGGRSFSSGSSRSFSAPSRPSTPTYSAPRPSTPAPSAAPKPTYTAPSVAPKTTTTTTTTTRRYSSSSTGSSFGSPVAYGGLGMGYGYSNGMLTGLLIGNMMHPHNTVVYAGPQSNGSTLLYPDGKVVNGNGQQVGTYDGQTYTPMSNGPVVAQPLPADVRTHDEGHTWYWWFGAFCLVAVALGLFVFLFRIILL